MTTFKECIDRAYLNITDYRLDKILTENEQVFYEYMGAFLLNAIDDFGEKSLTSLSYHTEAKLSEDTMKECSEYVFDNNLNSKEVRILSLGTAINWYKKELDDVTQFKLHLTDKSFKAFSEQANLSKRLERLEELKEEMSEAITDYQIGSINVNGMQFFNGGA